MKFIFAFILLLNAGCTFTTTRTIEPEFKNEVEEFQPGIEALITCKHINVIGAKKTENGNTETILQIDILNAASLPKSDIALRNLAKKIAVIFKDQLINQEQFGIYNIYFITQSNNGNVEANGYQVITFKSKEI